MEEESKIDDIKRDIKYQKDNIFLFILNFVD